MKLKDLKLSELKGICSRYKCSNCPLWDEQMNDCFFSLSRLPCQWRIADEESNLVCEHCGEALDSHGSCPNEDEISNPNCEHIGALACSYEGCDCPGCIEDNKEETKQLERIPKAFCIKILEKRIEWHQGQIDQAEEHIKRLEESGESSP